MRHIPDGERRARLARRHALAPWSRVADPEAATRAMTVLHSTEPATVYLSLLGARRRARRSPTSTAPSTSTARWSSSSRCAARCSSSRATCCPAAWGSASARVAGAERTRMAKDVVRAGLADDGEAWLDRGPRARSSRLADGDRRAAPRSRSATAVPTVAVEVDVAAGVQLDRAAGC